MSGSNHQQSSTADPPPFDPSQPSIPTSYPIKTLQELESRDYFKSFHYPFNKSSVPLLQNGALPNRPRILVCHDMQGGYLDDKWVQGGTNADAYAIWHWYLMDVFVYFSHSLVTLPPPCWTNAAHTHGVKVLGTFITEGGEGRVSNQLLSTKESAHMYAERLAELAAALRFDGWLINMEVSLDASQILNMKEFIGHLTKTMHSLVVDSLVIWYDSVTIDGNLDWQNQLNEKNKPFFDICDGIFTNYKWMEDYPELSAEVAGDRRFDVYMGIDVFGRGTFGDGQWNTKFALDVLKRDDVSAAIFAPGWIYETKQPPDFQTAQNHWWSLVEKSWGVVQKYPRVLPFYSNFDQGRGLHISVKGEKVLDTPWNNISSQGFQPYLEYNDNANPDTIQVRVDFKEASYNGGGNITFRGTLKDDSYSLTRLFEADFVLGTLPITFTFSVKSYENSLLGLVLKLSSATGHTETLLLASSKTSQFRNTFIMPRQVKNEGAAAEWMIVETEIAMNGYRLTGVYAVCFRPGQLESRPAGQDRLSLDTMEKYFAVLGHISIKNSGQNFNFPPSTSWLIKGQHMKLTSDSESSKTLSINITWELKDGDESLFPKYNIFVQKLTNQEAKHEYLGVAQVEAFYVSELVIPNGTNSIKFIIQVCAVDSTCQNLDDSPFLIVDV